MKAAFLPGLALKMFHHVSLAAALVIAAVPALAQQGNLRYGGQPYRQLPPQVMIQPYAGATPMYPQRIQQFPNYQTPPVYVSPYPPRYQPTYPQGAYNIQRYPAPQVVMPPYAGSTPPTIYWR